MDNVKLEEILTQVEDAVSESELDLDTKDNILNVIDGIRTNSSPANISVLIDLLKALSFVELEGSIDSLKLLMK